MATDVKELKEKLGDRAKEIIFNGIGMRGNINGKVCCPLHNDKVPSMSYFKEGNMWRCHACGENIDIYRYLTEFKGYSFGDAVSYVADMVGERVERFERAIEKNEFKTPKINWQPLDLESITYMMKRGIEENTLKAWGVVQRIWNNKKVYVFPYKDEKGKLTYVSYRKIGECGKGDKGGCEAHTKAILWGMDKIDVTKPVVVTEGQPDAMVIWQSGYKNVVSVPAGASNFKWIDNCWEWLQTLEKDIIVWVDNDKVGKAMGVEIKRRLKNVKILCNKEFKDANDLLLARGEKSVLEAITEIINSTPNGIIDVSNMEYRSVIDEQTTGIETGFIEYDRYVEDWKTGELTVVFGRNGEGKTTFISQVIAHNLYQKNGVFLYSGEMSNRKIQDWLYRQIVGKNDKYYRAVQTKYRTKFELLPDVVNKIKKWHKDKFFLFDRECEEVANNVDKFFEVMETCAKRYNCKLFVVDNLMTVLTENADSLNSDQANFVQRCKNFAVTNNVHVVLLAHPNKLKKEISGDVTEGNLEKTDISGSNNIPNKADNIIAVERVFDGENADAIITSLKDRESGQRLIMRFFFSKRTLRFYNENTCEEFDFGWDVADNLKIRKEYIINECDLNDDNIIPF